MSTFKLTYLTKIPLRHHGDCRLLGVTPALDVYVEEFFDTWMAQHAFDKAGRLLESVDEAGGQTTHVQPLRLPDDARTPQRVWHTIRLNFQGPRHQGLREPERVQATVRNIPVKAKMQLIEKLNLDMPAMMLLGLAESYVLAEAAIAPPHIFVVCRRIRLAYALPEVQHDTQQQPYDYDTILFHTAHFFDHRAIEPPEIAETLAPLGGVSLNRPMDCVVQSDHLFIADGGTAAEPSVVHIWRIDHKE